MDTINWFWVCWAGGVIFIIVCLLFAMEWQARRVDRLTGSRRWRR